MATNTYVEKLDFGQPGAGRETPRPTEARGASPNQTDGLAGH